MVIALSGFFISCATPAVSRPTIAMRRDSSASCAGFEPFRRGRPQLRADLIEHITQLAKLLVVSQIERGAEIAAAEPRQAAANHVHRPQHQLRQQHRR